MTGSSTARRPERGGGRLDGRRDYHSQIRPLLLGPARLVHHPHSFRPEGGRGSGGSDTRPSGRTRSRYGSGLATTIPTTWRLCWVRYPGACAAVISTLARAIRRGLQPTRSLRDGCRLSRRPGDITSTSEQIKMASSTATMANSGAAAGTACCRPQFTPMGRDMSGLSARRRRTCLSSILCLRVLCRMAGLLQTPENTETPEQTETTEQIEAIVWGVGVEEAIRGTLPREYGTRNHKVFQLARALRSLPQFADVDARELRPIVQEWYRRALPKIRTKEFEETWIDFLKAWPRILYMKGTEPMTGIFRRAAEAERPQIATVTKYPENERLQFSLVFAGSCSEPPGRDHSIYPAGKRPSSSP